MSQGNSNRIREFLKNEYSRMTHYVRGIIADASDRDSEDIVNDVVTRLFEKADITAPIEDVASYIYISLRNSVIDILRRRKTVAVSIDAMDYGAVSSGDAHWEPEKMYEKDELAKVLHDAVQALPRELGDVFMMHEVEGMSFREISAVTGIPLGTLTARKAHAVSILRNALKDYKIYIED
jgi:RNA polymerase sigma-70 factor (ECF subfamily)